MLLLLDCILERKISVQPNEYRDVKGQSYSLSSLDQQERKLIDQLQRKAASGIEWNEFSNFWMSAVGDFYRARGLSREQIQVTVAFRVAQDLDSRLGLAGGMIRPGDYRDELQLIRARFKTRRSFCEATGLSEDMLSHVLSKRKHLAIDTLADALARVGYALHIAEAPGSNGM